MDHKCSYILYINHKPKLKSEQLHNFSPKYVFGTFKSVLYNPNVFHIWRNWNINILPATNTPSSWISVITFKFTVCAHSLCCVIKLCNVLRIRSPLVMQNCESHFNMFQLRKRGENTPRNALTLGGEILQTIWVTNAPDMFRIKSVVSLLLPSWQLVQYLARLLLHF